MGGGQNEPFRNSPICRQPIKEEGVEKEEGEEGRKVGEGKGREGGREGSGKGGIPTREPMGGPRHHNSRLK